MVTSHSISEKVVRPIRSVRLYPRIRIFPDRTLLIAVFQWSSSSGAVFSFDIVTLAH